jgi:multicomponent Na+:H+ antiporter subunit B
VKEQVLVRVMAQLLIPFILLFGFYVIVHGELGPGGGFQGGVILASGVVLYRLVFGEAAARRLLGTRHSDTLMSIGVLVYAGVGVATLLLGGAYLEYGVFNRADPPAGQALGIFLVELGVGITVSAVMVTLFNEFVRIRRR